MAAYMVTIVKLTNRTPTFMEYAQKAAALSAKFGGKYVIRGPATRILEGNALAGASVVVSEWPTVASAEAFYDSTEYQQIKPLRDETGAYDIGIFEGHLITGK